MNPLDLVPVLLIFAVMYFLVIRPQVTEKQNHEKLLASLAKGDRVVTASGVHGTIATVEADTVVLDLGERVRVTVDKSSIGRRLGDDDASKKKKAEEPPAPKPG